MSHGKNAMRSGNRSLVLALGLAVAGGLVVTTRPAAACSSAPVVFHQVTASDAASDSKAPSVPVVTSVDVYRREGERCSGGTCVSSSCGDTATVVLEFERSTDDQTPGDEIGYGLQVLSGTVPAPAEWLEPRVFGGNAMFFNEIGFDDMPRLDATVVFVAEDNAGNVSRSQPFELKFSGCTKPPADDTCLETGADGAGSSSESCTLVSAAGVPPRAGGWWPAVLAAALVYRRRRALARSVRASQPMS